MKSNFALSLLVAITMSACGSDDPSSRSQNAGMLPCDQFDCLSMIENLSLNIIAPTYEKMAISSGKLVNAVDAFCESPADPEMHSLAKQAWRNTMNVWQEIEVMQLGPLVEFSGALRDNIYSWPIVSQCNVDQEVILLASDPEYDLTQRTPDRRGLDALEYILFSPTLSHQCPANIAVTADWNSRTSEVKQKQRCNYAILAAANIDQLANTIVERWSEPTNGFHQKLVNAGHDNSQFTSIEAAVNHLSDALLEPVECPWFLPWCHQKSNLLQWR